MQFKEMTVTQSNPTPIVHGANGLAEPRWQQRKAAMTRENIMQAAIDCLVECGYAGLTTSEIVRRANISRGAMHHHFANRTELVAALIDFVDTPAYAEIKDRWFPKSELAASTDTAGEGATFLELE